MPVADGGVHLGLTAESLHAPDDRLADAQPSGLDRRGVEAFPAVADERRHAVGLDLHVHRHLGDRGVAGGVVGGLRSGGHERVEAGSIGQSPTSTRSTSMS